MRIHSHSIFSLKKLALPDGRTSTDFLSPSRRRGFSLVEILVVIAVRGILAGVVVAGVDKVRQSAQTSAETSAARQVIQAFLMTPMENKGRFMLGYGDARKTLYPRGFSAITSDAEDAKRYPLRLAPLLENNLETLFAGKDLRFYHEVASKRPYDASLNPTFGMNSIFVGGHADGRIYDPGYEPNRWSRDQTKMPNNFWVLRPADAYNPSLLIVFASSLYSPPADYGEPVGFYRINPPKLPTGTSWGSYDSKIPASMGYVSLEHGGKTVAAHLDGHVEMLDQEQLRDMRRWSNQAAIFDDPDFSDWMRQ